MKFNNPVFRSTVDAVQGGRDVLRLYGYTEERPDGLSFPEGQEEPDEYQVAIVTLEVLLLRTELSLLLQVRWPSDPKGLSTTLGAPPNASHFEAPHAGEFCCCSSLEASGTLFPSGMLGDGA